MHVKVNSYICFLIYWLLLSFIFYTVPDLSDMPPEFIPKMEKLF